MTDLLVSFRKVYVDNCEKQRINRELGVKNKIIKSSCDAFMLRECLRKIQPNSELETWLVAYPRIAHEYALMYGWPTSLAHAFYISPEYASRYAVEILKKKCPRIECIIKNDAHAAYKYAHAFGRFKAAEVAISKDASASCQYGKYVLNKRFKMGEQAIITDAEMSWRYALDLDFRFREAEPIISKDAGFAHLYAVHIIKGRWPAGEKAIASNPNTARQYVRWILVNTRFLTYEKQMATSTNKQDVEYAFEYARDILKGRFPQAEHLFAHSPGHAIEYARLIKERFVLGEARIAEDPKTALRYAQRVLKPLKLI